MYFSVFSSSWVEIIGTSYNIGAVVVVGMDLLPQFGLLKHIIISDVHANYILFVYQAVHTICFLPNLHVYEVEIIAEDELLVVESFNLFDYKPLSIYQYHSCSYISLKYHIPECI